MPLAHIHACPPLHVLPVLSPPCQANGNACSMPTEWHAPNGMSHPCRTNAGMLCQIPPPHRRRLPHKLTEAAAQPLAAVPRGACPAGEQEQPPASPGAPSVESAASVTEGSAAEQRPARPGEVYRTSNSDQTQPEKREGENDNDHEATLTPAPEHTRRASWRHRRFNLSVYRRSQSSEFMRAKMTAFARVG